ncbi:MAG: hypothetical protein JNL82_16005 [Myxococcales bacterium]|nr:hypothetical protein [Myxococcales bacterium]
MSTRKYRRSLEGMPAGVVERGTRWRGGSMIVRWLGAALRELQGHFHHIKGFRV